jgi:hypothetical protein
MFSQAIFALLNEVVYGSHLTNSTSLDNLNKFFTWFQVGNQEAVDLARSLCMGVENADPLSACKKLADLSVSRGSCDDTSVMLIHLGRYV